MTPEQFVYWLQGFYELSDTPLTKREQMVKDHLKTIFHKVTPVYTPLETQGRDSSPFKPYNIPTTTIC